MMWWWLWFSDWWVCWPSNPHRLGHASKQRNRETWEHVCRPQPLLKRWDWVNAGDWGMWGKLPTRRKSLEPVLPFSHLGSSDMSISQFHWLTQRLRNHIHQHNGLSPLNGLQHFLSNPTLMSVNEPGSIPLSHVQAGREERSRPLDHQNDYDLVDQESTTCTWK